MSNPFEALGWSDEEYWASEERSRAPKPIVVSDKRICICGHPASSHASQTDNPKTQLHRDRKTEFCKSGKVLCPCRSFHAVVSVSDTRGFIFKSIEDGIGENHALARGIYMARTKNRTVTWDVPDSLFCARCAVLKGRTGIEPQRSPLLAPTAIQNGRLANGPGDTNIFLCPAHVSEVKVGVLWNA